MKQTHPVISRNAIGQILVIVAIATTLLPRTLDLSYHVDMLIYSTSTLLIILWGYNKAQLTWEEIQHQGFRLAVYLLSGPVSAPCPVLPGAVPHYPY